LSTLVFSDNVDLQRSASLTFAEITERGEITTAQCLEDVPAVFHMPKQKISYTNNGLAWSIIGVDDAAPRRLLQMTSHCILLCSTDLISRCSRGRPRHTGADLVPPAEPRYRGTEGGECSFGKFGCQQYVKCHHFQGDDIIDARY
jgi:hypothetical protein